MLPAWDVAKSWTREERELLRRETPKGALETSIRRMSVLEIAKELLKIAEYGLERRAQKNARGDNETLYLEPLRRILARGKTQADDLIALYLNDWKREVKPVYEYARAPNPSSRPSCRQWLRPSRDPKHHVKRMLTRCSRIVVQQSQNHSQKPA